MKFKTGLAVITGGRYSINHNEGTAMANVIPPPIIKNLDWTNLSDKQIWLISELIAEWEIIAHWLVSYRTRTVDTKQLPFTSQDFLNQRAKAELYSIQLDLCAEVWEAIEIRKTYPTPYDWWEKCMRDIQSEQLQEILSGWEGIAKGKVEDKARSLLRHLVNGSIPFENSHNYVHLYRLFECAIAINLKKWQVEDYHSERVSKAWNNYLDAFKELPKELKRNSDIKAMTIMGNRLYYRDRNTLRPISTVPVSIEALLATQSKFKVIV